MEVPMNKMSKYKLPLLLALAAGPLGFAAHAADWAAGMPLPESAYEAARKKAVLEYANAVTACGLVYWSARIDCEAAAKQTLDSAEASARSAYLNAYSDISALMRKADPAGQPGAAAPNGQP
jgi:hypothetical protein